MQGPSEIWIKDPREMLDVAAKILQVVEYELIPEEDDVELIQ